MPRIRCNANSLEAQFSSVSFPLKIAMKCLISFSMSRLEFIWWLRSENSNLRRFLSSRTAPDLWLCFCCGLCCHQLRWKCTFTELKFNNLFSLICSMPCQCAKNTSPTGCSCSGAIKPDCDCRSKPTDKKCGNPTCACLNCWYWKLTKCWIMR